MKHKRVKKSRVTVIRNTRTEIVDQNTRTRGQKEAEALAAEMDDLLDEIDQMLEENDLHTREAQQAFVTGYEQKGGQ